MRLAKVLLMATAVTGCVSRYYPTHFQYVSEQLQYSMISGETVWETGRSCETSGFSSAYPPKIEEAINDAIRKVHGADQFEVKLIHEGRFETKLLFTDILLTSNTCLYAEGIVLNSEGKRVIRQELCKAYVDGFAEGVDEECPRLFCEIPTQQSCFSLSAAEGKINASQAFLLGKAAGQKAIQQFLESDKKKRQEPTVPAPVEP